MEDESRQEKPPPTKKLGDVKSKFDGTLFRSDVSGVWSKVIDKNINKVYRLHNHGPSYLKVKSPGATNTEISVHPGNVAYVFVAASLELSTDNASPYVLASYYPNDAPPTGVYDGLFHMPIGGAKWFEVIHRKNFTGEMTMRFRNVGQATLRWVNNVQPPDNPTDAFALTAGSSADVSVAEKVFFLGDPAGPGSYVAVTYEWVEMEK